MSQPALLIDAKRDVEFKDLEEKSSKSFFLTTNKQLIYKQFYELFINGFPFWDKINGDEYRINNCLLKIPYSKSDKYEKELNEMIYWMESHLNGKFHISGIFYYKSVSVQFQYKDDMELSQKYFK
jgi:hypothetical protein